MGNEALLDLTADIVSAHVSNNSVSSTDLPLLIHGVYGALAGLGAEQPAVEPKPEPAVTVRSSVKRDSITCLDCGFKGKMLKRHLGNEHNLTPVEYKARWSLPADYPIVAPDYAEQRKELAIKIGLGRKPGQGKKAGRPKKAAAA